MTYNGRLLLEKSDIVSGQYQFELQASKGVYLIQVNSDNVEVWEKTTNEVIISVEL